MNGRCEKDALDRAEDICELCGNQYSASCLLYPRGQRKPPTCKDCALAHSGLRGTGSAGRAISRRTYKQLKKELLAELEGVEEKNPEFTFFDLNDPSEFHQSTELDRRPSVPDDPEPIDILATADDPPPITPPPPAVDEVRVPPPPPPPDPEVTAGISALDGLSPVDTSINPLAVGGPIEAAAPPPAPAAAPPPPPPSPAPAAVPPAESASEASASAAELLARLKADQPIQSQFNPTQRLADTDPFATDPLAAADPLPVAEPVTAASFDEPSSSTRPVGNPFGPTPGPEPAIPTTAVPPAFAPSTPATPTVSPPAKPPRPKIAPWTPPTPPPRGSNLDAMAASAMDAPVVAAPAPAAPAPAAPVAAAIPDSLRPPPASNDPAPVEEVRETRKADTDETGQWIPPSLRGIAPAEERDADPLPKRR